MPAKQGKGKLSPTQEKINGILAYIKELNKLIRREQNPKVREELKATVKRQYARIEKLEEQED